MPALDTCEREDADPTDGGGPCVNHCVLDWESGRYLIQCIECEGEGTVTYQQDCDCVGGDRDGHTYSCSTNDEPLYGCECASCDGVGGQLCPCDGGRVP